MDKDLTFLSDVAALHNEWIKAARALGGGDYSEDFVQETYIKLSKYATKDKIIVKNKVQKGYVFFTLRSIIRTVQSNKVIKDSVEGMHIIDDTCLDEFHAYEKFVQKIKTFLNNRQRTQDVWYDAKLFESYMITGLSIRELAKQSGISSTSIFHTIKRVKTDLIQEFGEDWQDYLNSDYDLI